jgi:DNA-directed RNA polymerase subunit RPC12/RpoP
MSKELEALNRMVSFDKKCEFIPQQLKDDFQLIEEALKRNEPMKPKVAWINEEDKNIVAYRCSNCNGSLGAKLDNKPMFPNFCRHCGQKLDWSDEQ